MVRGAGEADRDLQQKCMKKPGSPGLPGFCSDEIRIGLAQENETVCKPAEAEQAERQQIHDAYADSALVKFVSAEEAEEQAEEECDPFVPRPGVPHGGGIPVGIDILIVVMDDNGLAGLLQGFDLAATVDADDGGFCDDFSAVPAVFCSLLRSRGMRGEIGHGVRSSGVDIQPV